jgi:hypothetical protein
VANAPGRLADMTANSGSVLAINWPAPASGANGDGTSGRGVIWDDAGCLFSYRSDYRFYVEGSKYEGSGYQSGAIL